MKLLIQLAYDIRPEQLSGGPGWTDSELYTVVAKGPEGPVLSESAQLEVTRMRLQALLEERFHLALDMLPIVSNRLKLTMAPNIPIVYYLAPTERYDAFVALTDFGKWNTDKSNRLSQTKIRRFEGQRVGGPNGQPEIAKYSGFMTTLSGQARAALTKQDVKTIAKAAADLDAVKAALRRESVERRWSCSPAALSRNGRRRLPFWKGSGWR